jgi:hypothetical protein
LLQWNYGIHNSIFALFDPLAVEQSDIGGDYVGDGGVREPDENKMADKSRVARRDHCQPHRRLHILFCGPFDFQITRILALEPVFWYGGKCNLHFCILFE